MSVPMLHVAGVTCLSNRTAIVGDRTVLLALRASLDDALRSGSNGVALYFSDGAPHDIAMVLVDDKINVRTSCADEFAPGSEPKTQAIERLLNYVSAVLKCEAVQAAPV